MRKRENDNLAFLNQGYAKFSYVIRMTKVKKFTCFATNKKCNNVNRTQEMGG